MADAESQERRDLQITDLEGQLEHEASRASQYQNALGKLESSFDRVARALGCKTPEELENLVLGDRTVWNRRNIEWNAKRAPTLKEEIKAAKARVVGLESEGEGRARQLKEREESVEVLERKLAQAQAERDAAIADLTTARDACSLADKRFDEACDEVQNVRNAHDNMKVKHFALQSSNQTERERRLAEVKRLNDAKKKGKDALLHATNRFLAKHNSRHGSRPSDNGVKVEGTDTVSVLLTPAAKGKGKETYTTSVSGADSSPVSATTVLGMSSAPNTPSKPRRTAATGIPPDVFPTASSASGPGSSYRPSGAVFPAAEASDVPSSYTLSGQSDKAGSLRRSPRKVTPQKRKRPTNENENDEDEQPAALSSPRSDVSATQEETQLPHLRDPAAPLQFTPTKRARRTEELPTSLPRPLNALVLSASRGPSSSATPVGRGARLAPESLPQPPRTANALAPSFPRTRPATSPRRTAGTKRTGSLSLGSPGKATVSPKILRTYSKQMKRPILREADTTFEEKKARKRGRYSAPEPSISKAGHGDADDTEDDASDDEDPKKVFKYEEVVRGKRRKELDAEDCEECREYYEAVGPMPPRLQAPLWRSPTSSPQHQRHVHHHHQHRTEPKPTGSISKRGDGKIETTRTRPDEEYDADFDAAYFAHQNEAERGKHVDSHKQQISRHRAVFARPKTPPGYWDIDFPSTPKVDALNKEAYAMRMKKEGTNKKR